MLRITHKYSPVRVTCLLLLVCTGAWHVLLHANDMRGLRIYSASTQLLDDIYYLDAQLDYDLSETAIKALDSGVPLTFELEVEIYKPRKWLWNKSLFNLKHYYQVVYHALTQQYVVTNLNSGIQNSYSRRQTALLIMGRVNDVPLVARSSLPGQDDYKVKLRLSLDIGSLPAPMRPWSYLNSEWLLASEWFVWELD